MSVENKEVNWEEALKLDADKIPRENTAIEPENLKYYLTHSEYNILLLAVQSLIEDYSEQLEAGFPGSTGSSGTYWDSYRVIKKGATTPASDSTLYTSLMTLEKLKDLKAEIQGIIDNLDEKYLSKINPDTANELITFLKGLEVTDVGGKDKINITPKRLSFQHEGELGWGDTQYYIDSKGYAHLKGLILEEYLEVPELRYNRIEINVGDSWRAPGGGVILDVVESSSTAGTVTLKLDDGELGAVSEDDLCMGIYHFIGDGKVNNATKDTDNFETGEREIQGFATSYFQILTVSEDHTSFTYRLRPGYTVHPQPTMNFVGFGNTTNKNRQTSSYQTRTYQRYMINRDDWSYTMANISAQFGDLTTLGGDYDEYSAYLNNVYFTGKIEQIIADKIEVRLAKEKISVEKDALDQYVLGPQITNNVLTVMEGDRLLTPTNNTVEGDLKAGEYFINIEGTDITPGKVSINTVDRNITIGDSSNMTADIARILYNIKLKRANGKSESIAKYQEISFLKGIPGEPGAPGVAGVGVPIVYRGTWDATKTYYGNDKRMDIVKYEDHYWKAKNVSGSSTIGFEGINTKPGSSSSHWDSFGAEFESVATELLLAEKANIAEFAFENQTMYSQNGWIEDPLGVFTEVTDSGGDINNPLFKSNLYLNGKTGELQARTGYVGGFTIHKDMLQSTHGTTPSISLNGRTGAGHLAGKNIMWDSDGKVTFGANVSLSWSSITGAPNFDSGRTDEQILQLWKDSGYGTYIDENGVYTKTITALGKVTAGSFSLGNGNFVVDDSGILTAKGANITGNITSQSLITRQGMNGYISLNEVKNGVGDNMLKFRYPNGNLAAKFGLVNEEGELIPGMIWYDENGNEIWRAGKSGIEYVTVVPEQWLPTTKMFRVTTLGTKTTLTSADHEDIASGVNTIKCSDDGTKFGTYGLNANVIYYSYTPGVNPQATTNEQYRGLHTTQIKSTSNWIPNGWYVLQAYLVPNAENTRHSVELYRYNDGKLVGEYTANEVNLGIVSTQCPVEMGAGS